MYFYVVHIYIYISISETSYAYDLLSFVSCLNKKKKTIDQNFQCGTFTIFSNL